MQSIRVTLNFWITCKPIKLPQQENYCNILMKSQLISTMIFIRMRQRGYSKTIFIIISFIIRIISTNNSKVAIVHFHSQLNLTIRILHTITRRRSSLHVKMDFLEWIVIGNPGLLTIVLRRKGCKSWRGQMMIDYVREMNKFKFDVLSWCIDDKCILN